MKVLLTSFSIAAMIGLSGCGSSGSDGVSTSDLKGTWEKQCKNVNAQTSEKAVLVFTKSDYVKSDYQYSGIGCKNNEIVKQLDVTYNYILNDTVKTVDDKKAKKIESTVSGLQVAKGTFGNELPTIGTKDSKIIYIDNKQLYFGENKEPYTLNYQEYFSKK